MTALIARAYARPPLSWIVTVWNAIHDAASTTWQRRTATAALVAAGYTALAAGTQMPALYAGAVIGPVALLGAAPYQRRQARRHARQLDELAASLAGSGMSGAAARVAQTADVWRRRAEQTR